MGKWNIKTWLTSLVGREMQIKTSARGQCIHTGLDIIFKKMTIPIVGEDLKKQEPCLICSTWEYKLLELLLKSLTVS